MRESGSLDAGISARYAPYRKIPSYFECAQFISFQGDFLSEHDVARGQIVSGYKAPAQHWTAIGG